MYKFSDKVIARVLGDEIVFIDMTSGTYFGFEGTAARVWELLSGGATEEEAASIISAASDVSVDQCACDIREFVAELCRLGLVEPTEQTTGA